MTLSFNYQCVKQSTTVQYFTQDYQTELILTACYVCYHVASLDNHSIRKLDSEIFLNIILKEGFANLPGSHPPPPQKAVFSHRAYGQVVAIHYGLHLRSSATFMGASFGNCC